VIKEGRDLVHHHNDPALERDVPITLKSLCFRTYDDTAYLCAQFENIILEILQRDARNVSPVPGRWKS
jgi:hypothetical protein